jgi:predicted DNA-binding transcriptional regulator AlpA
MITLLRRKSAAQSLGWSVSLLHLRINQGLMPPPIKEGACSLWPSYEIDALNKARIRGATTEEVKKLCRELVAQRNQAA